MCAAAGLSLATSSSARARVCSTRISMVTAMRTPSWPRRRAAPEHNRPAAPPCTSAAPRCRLRQPSSSPTTEPSKSSATASRWWATSMEMASATFSSALRATSRRPVSRRHRMRTSTSAALPCTRNPTSCWTVGRSTTRTVPRPVSATSTATATMTSRSEASRSTPNITRCPRRASTFISAGQRWPTRPTSRCSAIPRIRRMTSSARPLPAWAT